MVTNTAALLWRSVWNVPPVRRIKRGIGLQLVIKLTDLAHRDTTCALTPGSICLLRQVINHFKSTNNKIQCLRCTANSSRTGVQCGRPALKSSKTQKCQFHGGRSTGPKTTEGKARIGAAHTVHGQETKTVRAARSAGSAKLSRIEDAMYLLEMTGGPRTRGRKARGYVPVRSLTDFKLMMLDDLLHPERGVPPFKFQPDLTPPYPNPPIF